MKWMVASDIHGSAKYCRELLDAYEREKADRLLLLGDLLYHGPRNDLPEEYAPKMVIAMLNAKRIKFCACAETAMRKWTRWCWNSRFWRITVCSTLERNWCMLHTGI